MTPEARAAERANIMKYMGLTAAQAERLIDLHVLAQPLLDQAANADPAMRDAIQKQLHSTCDLIARHAPPPGATP